MRLVLFGPTYPYRGGITHHTSLLARALRGRHDVLVVSPRHGYPGWLFPGKTDLDPSAAAMKVPSERLLGPLLPWTWWTAARHAARFEPDLVVIQWWSPYWAPSLASVAALVRRLSGARVAFICHNVLPHEGGGWSTKLLVRWALDRGDAFIVHSSKDEAALRELVPTARSEAAVRLGLLPSLTVSEATDRGEARSALGLAAEARTALFFGFVRPYKGLRVLINAMPEAISRVPGLQLLVAGEFWEEASVYQDLARSLGVGDRLHVDDRYVPNEDVGRYFAAADVVVLPYVQASQSGVVTVAMDMCLPVIASDIGGLPDAVQHGVNGLLVPPGDPSALAEALSEVLGDDATAAALRRGAAESARRFSWDQMVALIETLA